MKNLKFTILSLLLFVAFGYSQSQPVRVFQRGATPLYTITVIGRTIQAVNYEYRSEPTKIDFLGTVLQPYAHGEATIEGKRGATWIDAKFEQLGPPTQFGREYLTYVLWAITPDGRPMNLGEIILNHSDKAKLHVTAGLQAFGLMVTAEPYYSVAQPSDVVVMENVVRPDTMGKVEVVEARYNLLPRRNYIFDKDAAAVPVAGEMLPMNEYEAVLAVYQALNAVQIAKSEGADQYAADIIHRAERLLQEAQSYQVRKSDSKQIVMTAREATQAAEDARTITARRRAEENQGTEQSKAEPPELQ